MALDTFSEPKPTARAKRVLVVDDLADSALTLAAVVRYMGHEVEVARDGQEALFLVDTFRPELVLLDLGMPGMTGFDVCQVIKSHPETRRIRVVAVTGYEQPQDRVRTAAAGFDGHYAKPINPSDLELLLKS